MKHKCNKDEQQQEISMWSKHGTQTWNVKWTWNETHMWNSKGDKK